MPEPPADLWAGLDPTLPIALLPVRLETRFGDRPLLGGDGTPTLMDDGTPARMPVLRVRVYPDELTITTTAIRLTAAQWAAGTEFWAAQRDPAATADLVAAAWARLVGQVGTARAVWAARETRSGPPTPPDTDTDTGPAERPATAVLLPDGWLLAGWLDGAQVLHHYLPRPAGDLQVGPSRDTPAFTPEDPTLVAPEDPLRWAVDFDAASRAGMAATVDLATADQVLGRALPPVAIRGLDTLVAVGVREPTAERTPDREAESLTALLTGHADRDTLALLAPGTPTNNLTDRPSGYSSRPDPFASLARLLADPAAGGGAVDPGAALSGQAADGEILEAALGLPAATLAATPGAAGREQAHARAMTRALFPVTLGEVIGTLARPQTPNPGPAAAERFLDSLDRLLPFAAEYQASFVRGRGPLPTLRVGRQPYGILPILPPGRWVRHPAEPALLDDLNRLIDTLRPAWALATRWLPRLRPDGDPVAQLVSVLGTAPVPHPGGYRIRSVTGPLGQALRQVATGMPTIHDTLAHDVAAKAAAAPGLIRQLTRAAYRETMLAALCPALAGSQLEGLTLEGARPMAVPVARTDPARVGWESPARYLAELANRRYSLALRRGIPGTPPTDLLYLLVEHALALAGELDAIRLVGAVSPAGKTAATAAVAVPAELAGTKLTIATPTHFASTALERYLDAAAPQAGLTVAHLVDDEVLTGNVFEELHLPRPHVDGFPGTVRAVGELAAAGLDDAGYTRLVGETLACVSTRLDAWITSVAARRLSTLRQARPDGIQLGAWGVLVDVRPRPGRPVRLPPAGSDPGLALLAPVNGAGYVHAPSLDQARTAGVLRAGEFAHAGDSSALHSIDLRSRQARVASDILDAVANGQPLGAVLGYRLERALGDAGAHSDLYRLRDAYPQTRIGQRDDQPGGDAVVPDEVVDGLAVWQDRAAKIVNPPPADQAALNAALDDLGHALDAVADLVVAEGVHQLTSGRAEVAGAGFAATALGTQPPDITVTRQPRSGVTVTHRTVLLLDGEVGSPGWNAATPRALLAPAAERWAQGVLGAAGGWQIPVGAATVGLDALAVAALDVIAEAADTGGHRPLADRLRAAAGEPEAALPAEADGVPTSYGRLLALAELAGTVLAAARPARQTDLTPPPGPLPPGAAPEPAPPGASPDALRDLARTVSDVLDALELGSRAVLTALTPADGPTPPDEHAADRELLMPFTPLALPGSLPPAGTAPTVRDVLTAAVAASALVRDADRLVTDALAAAGPR
ncbi:hypothetical protein, partial [Frankia sp. Cj5]|uniref:hypothetical protein n=1 Tax=Frankia sp. Cj5 TaxID=2880978 RepID=UPI001EF4A89E